MTDSDEAFDAEFDAEFGCDDLSATESKDDEETAPDAAEEVAAARHPAEAKDHDAHFLPQVNIPRPADNFSCSPKEVLIRIMSFLSAADLSSVGNASHHLHAVSREDILWRRLYCARWGKPKDVLGNVVWKSKYVDADTEEFHQTMSGAPAELRSVFSDMQKAKRQTCLGRALVDDTAELPRCQVQRQLAEWKRQRGFTDGAHVQRPDLTKASLSFHRIGPDTFVCEDTGWVHLCDQSCREGFIDADSGLITCAVSGRTSARLVSHHEELSLQQRSVDACFAAVDQELNSYSAAKAYTDGYYADEKEMRLRYGVKMR